MSDTYEELQYSAAVERCEAEHTSGPIPECDICQSRASDRKCEACGWDVEMDAGKPIVKRGYWINSTVCEADNHADIVDGHGRVIMRRNVDAAGDELEGWTEA